MNVKTEVKNIKTNGLIVQDRGSQKNAKNSYWTLNTQKISFL